MLQLHNLPVPAEALEAHLARVASLQQKDNWTALFDGDAQAGAALLVKAYGDDAADYMSTRQTDAYDKVTSLLSVDSYSAYT